MKLIKKVGVVFLSTITLLSLGAGGNQKLQGKLAPRENTIDSNLNSKMNDLKYKMKEQKAGITEATEMFKAVFPNKLEGSAKVEKLWFEQGFSSIVILDSPLPIKIIFKGQYLKDNKILLEKVGKEIKFKITDVSLVEEPVLNTLRLPLADTKFWIHATFSDYGKVKDGDYIDNIKANTIPY
ncbi:MAG: hypothetical protein AABZ74_03335 [Cyanobacteriota bacterium]|jgi:hypothetical protein